MKLKELLEKRAMKQAEMKAMLDKANEEKRTLSTEEQESFGALEAEIRDLDATIHAIQTQRDLDQNAPSPEDDPADPVERSVEEREHDAFEAFLRGTVIENRDVDYTHLTMGDNGAVVPTSIANKIIEKVVDMCPIYHDADRYNMTGNLQIPYYDDETNDIVVAYVDEFTDPANASNGQFKNISLTGFLARAVADVSKSLMNNSKFNIVDFVINRMARNIALFLEKELLIGTTGKVAGLSGVTLEVETESATAITADELIDLQEAIPDAFQSGAYFIMKKSTRTAIRKLKDGQGNYLLNKDANSRWGYTLFGKDVYTSDNMPEIKADNKGKAVIYYGDYKGLAVKVSEEVNIDVLRETKARQHAVEVLGFVEFDAKVQNAQMIAKMTLKKS